MLSLLCEYQTATSPQLASLGLKQGKGKEETIGACFLRSFLEAPPNNWAQMLARLGHEAACIIEEAVDVFRGVRYNSVIAGFCWCQGEGRMAVD